jgi:hypothetical protein
MNLRPTLAALALALSGCLSHMPPDGDPAHLHLDWRSDGAEALQAAAETGRPLLLVLVAGDIRERC